MRGYKITLVLAGIVALGACSGDASKVFTADNPPTAFVRFVNAVSDTGGQDWRFVDQIEGSPTTFALPFRGIFPGAGYQGATAGSRHLTVFQAPISLADPTLATPAIVSTVFYDTTFNFVAGSHYTIMAVGTRRSGASGTKLYILTDDFGDPGAQISVRVVNAGAGGSIDVYGSPSGGTSALPSSSLAGAVGLGAASKWVAMATGPLALRVFTSGTTAFPAMIDATAPVGVAADRSLDLTAIGGSTIPGTAFTAFFFPRSVAGSIAPNFATPGMVVAVDRYPPSGF